MNQKPIWQFPWLYKESFIFIAGLIFIGTILQLIFGPFNSLLLSAPINIVIAAILLLLICACTCLRQHPVMNWLASIPFTIALLTFLLILSLLMGLIPQGSGELRWTKIAELGLTTITSSWPFVLLYLLLLLTLGLIVTNRIFSIKKRRSLCFILNHFGLWFLLLTAGLGYADIKRYMMEVTIGEMEIAGYAENSHQLEPMPIAIELKNFSMDSFEPKLYIANRQTGTPLPDENKPYFYQVNMTYPYAQLGDWKIHIEQYLPKAASTGQSYRIWPVPGSVPAVLVEAEQISSGKKVKGWISCQSISQPYRTLELDEQYDLVMAVPEPKKFQSDVVIFTQDDQRLETQLVVNHPVKIGNWYIYQYGYDQFARDQSSFSTFELVYDPWLYWVYAGFGLMTLGAFGLIFTGRKRGEK